MLTPQQKETLNHLDQEMARRQKEEDKQKPRREHMAKATGIPISMIDSDVIRWGTWLGLIKNQAVRLGEEKDASINLLQWFNQSSSTKAPLGFKLAKTIHSEEDRLVVQKNHVHQQCVMLANLTQHLLDHYAKQLASFIDFTLPHYSWDHFVIVCQETIECIHEELLTCSNDKILWAIYQCCKPIILMGCGILHYQTMLHQHVVAFKQHQVEPDLIYQALDGVDLKLLLMPRQCIEQQQVEKMMHEVVLRSWTKSPQLCVFDFNVILQHCCIPSFMWLSMEFILEYGLMGPYFNNNIGYQNIDGANWSFYILTKMNQQQRLWTLDYELFMFTRQLSMALGKYMMHWFQSFYRQDVGHANFVPFFWDKHKEYTIMLKNILFISDYKRLASFLHQLVRQKSTLIPTELDYFNVQEPLQVHVQVPGWFDFSSLFDPTSDRQAIQEGWIAFNSS